MAWALTKKSLFLLKLIKKKLYLKKNLPDIFPLTFIFVITVVKFIY